MNMNVVVVGGSNIDVCAKSSAPLVKKDSNIGKVEFGVGGVGRNIAECLSLFGADVSLLTAIGDDSFGSVIADHAQEQGITMLAPPFKNSKTGVYTYIADTDGDIFVGINDMEITQCLTPEVIEENINALYFTDYVVFEANLPQDTIDKICSYDFRLVADCVSVNKCGRLKTVIDRLFLLKANKAEAFSLTGADSTEAAARCLVNKGLKRGIITMGADGAVCFEAGVDGIRYFEMPNAPDMKLVDTSGCGDALLAGFMIGLMRGRNMDESLVMGQAAACLNAQSLASVNRKMSYGSLKETVDVFRRETSVREGLWK